MDFNMTNIKMTNWALWRWPTSLQQLIFNSFWYICVVFKKILIASEASVANEAGLVFQPVQVLWAWAGGSVQAFI